jgi:hypothetical protein
LSFLALISSVSAPSMNTFTAIFLDLLVSDELHGDLLGLGGLVLDDDDGDLVGGLLGILHTFTAIYLDSACVFLVAVRAAFPAVCFPRLAPRQLCLRPKLIFA